MQHYIMEKVLYTQGQSGLGIALLAMLFVDQDAQSSALVDAVVVEDVDAADGFARLVQVNHQAELFGGDQVVVAQQKLLNLKTAIGNVCPADPPDVAVVLPSEDKLGVVRLGATKGYRFVLDKHDCRNS